MKKLTKILIVALVALLSIASMSIMACTAEATDIPSDNPSNNADVNQEIYSIYVAYAESVTAGGGTPLDYQAWLDSIKGANGKDGTTPTISIDENGFWVINGVTTTVNAYGSQGEQYEYLTFYPTDNGEYYVSLNNARYLSDVSIPATYNGKSVVGLSSWSFVEPFESLAYFFDIDLCQNSLTKTIQIPNSVRHIEPYFAAFSSLESITIPDSVQNIDHHAFASSTCLKEVILSNSITAIENQTFYDCESLEYVVIPQSVTSIGDYAFSGCPTFYIFYTGSQYMWNNINISSLAFSQESDYTVYYAGEWHMENSKPVIDVQKEPTIRTSISVCVASEPQTIDPALNSSIDGSTLIIHTFAGLVKYDSTGNLVADCAEELPTPTVAPNGEATYVFKLKSGLKWSDGTELKASDFEWAWKRAASYSLCADYGYMFEIINGYGEYDVDGLAPLAVVANDNARTLTVTTTTQVPYFFEICAFPTYMPVRKDIVDTYGYAWATSANTYISNGPYVMTSWSHDRVITLKKNPNYHDAASITMDEIKFYLSSDASTMVTKFKNGTWQFIDDMPVDELESLRSQYSSEFYVGIQLGTYYLCFNNNYNFVKNTSWAVDKSDEEIALANAEVKTALSLLIDRNYICEEIVQAGQEPAPSFVSLGITEADRKTEFYMVAGNYDANGYYGYYDVSKNAYSNNLIKAINILKKYFSYNTNTGKFTNFPTFTYVYNTGSGHQAIAEYVQGLYESFGINVYLQNQEWNEFLEARYVGDYILARNGWIADYNDPISFLDMWTTESGNNCVQFGKAPSYWQTYNGFMDAGSLAIYDLDLSDIKGYESVKIQNGTWAETYDLLISYIKCESNEEVRYKLMHRAEDLLMSTGNIVPIYYYTDIYMLDNKVNGFFANPLGFKYFMYTTIDD